MDKKVIVYSTNVCPYCVILKDYLRDKGILFEEVDISSDFEKQKEMVEKSGQLGVPVVDIDGTIVVGFDKERIASLLDIAS